MAEGFSASIAPSLEATDVDAINTVARGGEAFEVTMKNEALETHSVRHVDLLALPRVDGRRAIALGAQVNLMRTWDSGFQLGTVFAYNYNDLQSFYTLCLAVGHGSR